MGVVKTASESILEETVVPSEEANYSQQGYAGKRVDFLFPNFTSKKRGERERDREGSRGVAGRNPMERKARAPRGIRCRDQGRSVARSLARSLLRLRSQRIHYDQDSLAARTVRI